MGGGLASFWEERNIQTLVILSFALQAILLCCAGIRRSREASGVLRILLWLAYLMADYTAIYALGHMSITMTRSRSPPRPGDHHQMRMVPFWAPFLLLHLGGPDTITAYAYQDNQLWLRHLLTLAGQVLGAIYVMYLFVAPGRNPAGTLLAAAALMFVTGCLKYGERTWALKCGSIDSIKKSLDDDGKSSATGGPYHGREGTKRLDTEEVLLGAHHMLNFCKGLLADGPVMQKSEYEVMRQGIQLNGSNYVFQLAAMELSLLYDILYTKAAVLHTWHGLCIRIVAPLSVVAAFVLFQLSSKEAYSRADVAVTYILLVGAMALELASSLRAAGSSWACASYHARGWHGLCGAVMRLRRMLKVGARRSVSLDSLGQYNLLDLCTDANKDGHLRGKIAKMIGLKDRWQKMHYSSTAPVSDAIKTLVLREIRKRKIDDLRNARGRWILKEKEMYEDLTRIADDTELDRSIMVWHIATDLYLSLCPGPDPDPDPDKEVRDSIRVLSNHMLFLMVVHPYLLPGVVRTGRYKENLKYYDMVWWVNLKATKESTMKLSRPEIIKKIADRQLPADSRRGYIYGIGEEAADDVGDRPVYADGSWLAGMLHGNRWHLSAADMLEVIAGVWVEMLCYASHHCGEESHAKKLSTGAEFMNAVWLIIGHATVFDRYAPSAEGLTGGLGLSNPPRKRKIPARWTQQPEADVGARPPGVPPGVHPAYAPFFDVEAHQTSSAQRHHQ
ncbi:uncharacterized protein LOC119311571 [Triticum dicoccoides]|uniref:uncharacterized protein LOC119311571 n=1 Tax=Triticum dicoccoides TaxID=85692 RepID=UPI00189120AF|nr:uncharacterized protein LOC119311571 [Triticum dicoccoides]